MVSAEGGPPARAHTAVVVPETGEEIGEVTSGCPSPSMQLPEGSKAKAVNIAMAYVPKSLAKNGTKLSLKVRNRTIAAEVTKMPFVPTKYYSG